MLRREGLENQGHFRKTRCAVTVVRGTASHLPDRKNSVLIFDLTAGSTTHELLYKLFASETGLLSVAHPETQYAAVVEVMQTLRARILERLADSAELDFFSGDHTYLGKLAIPLKVDAPLFVELYKDLNRFNGAQTLLSHTYIRLSGA